MIKVNEGNMVVKGGKKFAIVISRFNDMVTKSLLDGCSDTLKRHGAKEADVEAFWVPGSFEIPTVANKIAKSKKFDAVICLGAVIRGDTPHFDFIASEAAKGVASVSMQTGVPVIFGVITADTMEQAIERAGIKGGNKGRDAALNAIEMVNLLDII
ncbi:MAG TPA: 6,7-dimethyl-8-ribityllumazine synthase [Candidatus Omnitrophota bacterium]|nr:6,7-dimethyl-8-ribityllumazine synthase [Candidatus Omnitrophota bacterium]